jgi:hypothetical protein
VRCSAVVGVPESASTSEAEKAAALQQTRQNLCSVGWAGAGRLRRTAPTLLGSLRPSMMRLRGAGVDGGARARGSAHRAPMF